jgi:hypothetical protein
LSGERRCPFCHDDLGVSLVSHCDGCNALFHKACAAELAVCATLGCDRRLRERAPLPLTGRSLGQIDAGRVFLAGLALTALPSLGMITWAFATYGDAGWQAWIPLALLVGAIACGSVLPLATGGRRGRWRVLSD